MSIKNIIILLIIVLFSQLQGQNYLGRDWKYYLKKGNLQFRAEMYNFALESFKKALDRNTNAFEAANMLAKISLIKNKREDALRWFLVSLRINNNQADIHYRAGSLYDFFADYDKAYHHYKESIKIKKGHIASNMALVRFYYKKKNYKKAQYYFNVSRQSGLKIVRPQLKKAKIISMSDTAKAIEIYRNIIKKAPATIEAYENLFNLYRFKKQYMKAAGVMEHLKFIKPDDEKAYVFLGHLYFNTRLPGNTRRYYLNESIKNLKKAHQINPKNSETLLTLARVYFYIKRPLLGKKMMREAEIIERNKRLKH